jgi:hypothetical protein
MKTIAALASTLLLVHSAVAQDMPVPKMFKGMQGGEKGRWQMEVLEAGGRPKARGMTVTVCTDNLMNQAGKDRPKAESSCKHKLLKDTADEAVVESECRERKSTITIKRDGKSMLMTMESTGPKGPQAMKMRYTHLGPCREGQGAVNLDKDSEQCRKMRERAAKMDPARQCARQKSEREACEQKIRDAAAQMQAMCS